MALLWDILHSNPNIAQQCFSGFGIMIWSFFIMENYINKNFKYSALYVCPGTAGLSQTVDEFLTLQGTSTLISIVGTLGANESSSFSTSSPAFMVLYFLDDGHSDWGEK